MEVLLKLVNVSKSFGALRAVDNVSLEIYEGEIVGLIGPNGSGKTTLFNLISGVLQPDSGEIYFNGIKINKLPPYERFKLGICYSFQIPRLFRGMSVIENTLLPFKNQIGESLIYAVFRSKWVKQEISNAYTALKLLNKAQLDDLSMNLASQISGGQMKILQLIRTLVGKPKLMLLDEPGAGIHPLLAKELFKLIKELRDKEGITLFIIEHRLELLFDIIDRVLVMHKGRIIFDGKPQEALEDKKVKEAYLGM